MWLSYRLFLRYSHSTKRVIEASNRFTPFARTRLRVEVGMFGRTRLGVERLEDRDAPSGIQPVDPNDTPPAPPTDPAPPAQGEQGPPVGDGTWF